MTHKIVCFTLKGNSLEAKRRQIQKKKTSTTKSNSLDEIELLN